MSAPEPALVRLIDRVREAAARGLPLRIRGGATKDFYGESPVGEPLDLGELSGILSYEPTELVVTARGGTPLAELEAALESRGQCLPFEPPRFAAGGTVGGMVAAGLAGPARASAGSVRDHVLGVTLLNGRAETLSFGGQVAKNVAGYDVSRLIAGSLGILGVICDVSLKVMPVAVSRATLRFDCEEREALDHFSRWAAQPLPINASAWHGGQLHVRMAGARAAVNDACGRLGGAVVPPEVAEPWWRDIRDHRREFFTLTEADRQAGKALWRLSVPATTPPLALPGEQCIEWHGAQRWWRTDASASVVRAAAAMAGGHATLVRGGDRRAGVFTPLDDALLRIHRSLKRAFDPASIFNRDRLYAGL
jgi:FAD/FMN-containing dehydrogenase